MKMTMKLDGAGQLGRGLKALTHPDELEAIKLAALMEAGEPIRDQAKLEAPFDEGRLFTAVELETDFTEGRHVKTRTGVAIWVRYTNDYRPLKRKAAPSKRRKSGRGQRDYQKGSIPAVYGAFLNFIDRFGPTVNWFGRAWDVEGGRRAVDRISDALNWSLVARVRQRLSDR